MTELNERLEKQDNEDSVNWLLWCVVGLVVLILVFAGMVVKSAFFSKEVPRTAAERDIFLYEGQVERNPKDPLARVNLGMTYFQIGQEGKAIKEFEKAVSLDSNYAEPHYHLAVIYERKGEIDNALRELKKTVELDSKHDFACYLLGKIYLEQDKYEEAIKVLEKCVELKPVSADAHYALGSAYEKNGQKDLAINEYKETLKYIPNHEEAKKALKRLTAS
ncbi:MAG TPA: tetratricopeptide repeat protein [Actinobacteria bacterium]|nr:tetratricopeptide repeat protein [Actinomycetota bacterium]